MRGLLCCLLLVGSSTAFAADQTLPQEFKDIATLDPKFKFFIADLIELQGRSGLDARELAQLAVQHKDALSGFLHAEYEQMLHDFQEPGLANRLKELRWDAFKVKRIAEPKSFLEVAWNTWAKFKEDFIKFAYVTLKDLNKIELGRLKLFDFDEMLHKFMLKKTGVLGDPTELNKLLADFKISETFEFQKIMHPVTGIRLDDPEENRILHKIAPILFDTLSVNEKRDIVLDVLRSDPNEPVEIRAAKFLQRLGMLYKKNLQRFATGARSEEI